MKQNGLPRLRPKGRRLADDKGIGSTHPRIYMSNNELIEASAKMPTMKIYSIKAYCASLLAIFALLALAACEYSGSPLTDMTTVDGPPDLYLAPSFPLDLPPEERLRTAQERIQLLEELQDVSEQELLRNGASERTISTRRLGEEDRAHFGNALSEIEEASSAVYTPPDCDAADPTTDLEC